MTEQSTLFMAVVLILCLLIVIGVVLTASLSDYLRNSKGKKL